jgi:hypothetical protein
MRKVDHSPNTRLQPGDENYVGRGHPPKHSQIRPNEVRNPYGRKGKRGAEAAQDFAGQMAQLMAQPIRAKDGQTYAPPQVILNGLLKAVSAGDTRAVKLYLELCEKYLPGPSAAEHEAANTDVRRNAIEEALERLAAKRAASELANIGEGSSTPAGGIE